jgi:Rab GDP dissociation inhibitor
VYRDGRISKVPSTEMEAVRSSLMGLFEKRRAKNFFQFLQNWREEDPATHQGECGGRSYWRMTWIGADVPGLDINKCSMKDLYTKFGLEAGTQDFVGHAMALWLDDE